MSASRAFTTSPTASIFDQLRTDLAADGTSMKVSLARNADDILPALLITTRHPSTFRESFSTIRTDPQNRIRSSYFPLRKICNSAQEVADVIHRVFQDIKAKKHLSDFQAAHRMRGGVAGALVDAVILQPEIWRHRLRSQELLHPPQEIRRRLSASADAPLQL